METGIIWRIIDMLVLAVCGLVGLQYKSVTGRIKDIEEKTEVLERKHDKDMRTFIENCGVKHFQTVTKDDLRRTEDVLREEMNNGFESVKDEFRSRLLVIK